MCQSAALLSFSGEEAVERYGDTVYRLAYAKTGSKTDADDIFQEVFFRYLRAKPVFEGEEHAKAWFLRVTLNCTKSFWSSSFRRRTAPLDESIPVEDHPEEGVMESYLKQLPETYRAVIHLFYYEDLTTAQIAALLKRREVTVRMQLTRARQMLKDMMERDEALEGF